MMGKKIQRVLQAKKLRLEALVADGNKIIDEMQPEIKAEIRRICVKLGLEEILKGKPRAASAANARLLPNEYALLRAFHQIVVLRAENEYQLKEIELLLSPGIKGRPTQSDPQILAALKEWKDSGRKKSLRYLASKHCGKNDPVTRTRFLERLKKATRKERLATAPNPQKGK